MTTKKINLENKGVVGTEKDLRVLGDKIYVLYSKVVEINDGKVIFNEKLSIPIKAMTGVIGAAPKEGEINCGTSSYHGGHMNTILIGEHSKLHLLVFVDNDLFALGDLYAEMGDGIICMSDIEVNGTVIARLKVLKNLKLNNSIIKTAEVTTTIASNESIEKAIETAVKKMLKLFHKYTTLSIEKISTLFSISGNLQKLQVVDSRKTAHFSMPNQLFAYRIICKLGGIFYG